MSLEKVGVVLTAEGASAFLSSMAKGDQAIADFGKSATSASGKISGFGEIATGALRAVGGIAVDMAAQGIKALGGFFVDSVKKAGDFQAGMNEFAAVSGGALQQSGKSLKDFSDLFIQLGRDLPVSTKDVEDAAINLVKAGIDPATVAAGGLRTSLDLAAAGGVGLGQSADILGKQLGVWVDSAATAADKSAFLSQAADLLSQSANVTTSDVGDMALGLANVGGVAKVAGVSFQDTVRTMALISPSFSSAADAGTSFKSFLQRLQPTTKPAVAAMRDLGLYTDATGSAFYDQQGNFVGMEKASALLNAATSGLTDSQKSLAFQTIFGTDAIRTAAVIAEKGAAGFDDMGKQMDAAGSVAAQAAARQQGLNTAWDNTQGSLEALQLTLGAQLIPMLTTFLNTTVAPGINAITSFADSFFSASDKVTFLTAALITAFPQFAALIALGSNVVTAFGADGLSGALDALGASLPAVGQMLLGFGQQFLSWIGPLASQALTALGGFAASVGAWILQQAPIWGAQLLTWGEAFVAWVTPYVTQALAKLGEFAASIGSWIVQQAPQWAAQLVSWGEAFVNWVSPYISQALGKLGEFVSAAWAWVQQQAPTWITNLEAWGVALYQWVEPQVALLLGKLGDLASSVWAWVAEQAPILLSKLEAWGQSMIDWVAPQIAPLLDEAGALATSFIGWIGEQAAPILDKLGTWASSFIAWIGPATVDFLKEWPGMLSQFLDWIGGAAAPILLKLGEWALQFTAWIVPMIPGFIVGLGAIALALITFVGETVVTLAAKLLEWATAFGAWIGKDLLPKLPGLLDTITSAIGTWITGTAVPWLTSAAGALGTAIIDGIKSMVSAGGKLISDAISSVISDALAAAQRLFKIGSPSRVFADEVGQPIVAGMQMGMLNEMPNLLAAMRGSLDSTIQEIVSFVDGGPGETLNQAGADAINAFIAGMSQAASPTGFVKKLTDQLGQGTGMTAGTPDTTGLWQPTVDATKQAWDQIHQGVTNQITATKDTATQIAGQLGANTASTWNGVMASTGKAFGIVRGTVETQLGAARGTANVETGIIRTTTDRDFQLVSDATKKHFDQVHTDVTSQITAAKTQLGQATGAMQTGTAKTFGQIATNAKTNWDTTKTNVTTAVGQAKDTVSSDSTAMQRSMIIPLPLQSQIEQTYQSVTDTMVHQIKKVTEAINDLYNRWVALLNLPKPHGPGDQGGVSGDNANPGGTPGPGGKQPLPGKALGGPVVAGMSYMVGERGKELFTPNVNGYILPASVTQRIAPPASPQQIYSRAISSQVTNVGPTFNVTGNYRYESEQTITQKVRTLAMLYGSTT